VGDANAILMATRQRLYCGFEDAIEVFDINYPGEGTRLATTPSRKSRDGLKGIVSALAFCHSYDPSYRLYAAGSLSPSSANSANIALFDEDTGEKPVGWVGDIKASVMQLAFNPLQSHILYASFRRRDEIHSWDLRGSTMTPLETFRYGNGSRLETNQRMRFDIDLSGKLMGVGDQNGNVSMFSLTTLGAAAPTEVGVEKAPLDVCSTAPSLKYHAHDDTIGSVAFHPLHPLLLSVSGSRHFDDIDSGEESSDSSISGEASRGDTEVFIRRHRHRPQPSFRDNSIRLWHFGGASPCPGES